MSLMLKIDIILIHNFNDLDHFNNIDDVAALCSALDFVVSTKTTVPAFPVRNIFLLVWVMNLKAKSNS